MEKINMTLTFPYTKINSKWFIDVPVRRKVIKFLKENIRENLCDLEIGKDF